MHGHQCEKQELDPKKIVVIVFLSFRAKHKKTTGGGEDKTDPLRHARLVYDVRYRFAAHPPAKQTQVRDHNHRGEKGNTRQMQRQSDLITVVGVAEKFEEPRVLEPDRERKQHDWTLAETQALRDERNKDPAKYNRHP